jgi:hypothetical protein
MGAITVRSVRRSNGRREISALAFALSLGAESIRFAQIAVPLCVRLQLGNALAQFALDLREPDDFGVFLADALVALVDRRRQYHSAGAQRVAALPTEQPYLSV